MDRQRDTLVFVPDLFFQSKIVATAKATNVAVRLLASEEGLLAASQKQPGSVIVLDLGGLAGDPTVIIRALKTGAPARSHLLVGFCSHVDRELERRAREAGCDLVLPKSAFTKRLPEILAGRI